MPLRLKQLNTALQKNHLQGLLISHQPNITYLTGFPSCDSYLLVTPKESFLITDSRFYEHARLFFYSAKKSSSVNKRPSKTITLILNGKSAFYSIAKITLDAKIKRLGFESRNLNVAEYQQIKKLIHPAKCIATCNMVEELRKIKDAQELAKIKRAVKISIQALRFAQRIILPGIKEIEIAAQLEHFIRYKGARTTSFETIVASGKNSSFPHHLTANRKLRKNESLFIDFGVDYQGYKSDLTRVFFLGKIPSEITRIYNIVRQAQIIAINKIKPEVKICEIDNCARQHIAKCGYGKFFSHSLGHGIGLEIHEQPFISANSKETTKAGMVFTVEPAIYLPNKFGIRIEDNVIVTKNGCEVLSDALDK